jgi:hypothetical protein
MNIGYNSSDGIKFNLKLYKKFKKLKTMEHYLWRYLWQLLKTTIDIASVDALTLCIYFSALFKSYLQLKRKIL